MFPDFVVRLPAERLLGLPPFLRLQQMRVGQFGDALVASLLCGLTVDAIRGHEILGPLWLHGQRSIHARIGDFEEHSPGRIEVIVHDDEKKTRTALAFHGGRGNGRTRSSIDGVGMEGPAVVPQKTREKSNREHGRDGQERLPPPALAVPKLPAEPRPDFFPVPVVPLGDRCVAHQRQDPANGVVLRCTLGAFAEMPRRVGVRVEIAVPAAVEGGAGD